MESHKEVDELILDMDLGFSFDPINVPVVKGEADHPRINLYKNRGRALDQERRWRNSLRMHQSKASRDAKFDGNRDLSSFDQNHNFMENNKHQNSKHPWAPRPKNYVPVSWRSCSNNLMLAEWLLFLPPGFSKTYTFKLCPKGRHVFIKAQKGLTKVFSRTGRLLYRTRSRLPGGGLGQSDHHNFAYSTLLDCIMLPSKSNTLNEQPENRRDPEDFIDLRVLDVICFRTTSYCTLPFRERCDWLESYLREQIEDCQPEDPIRLEVIAAHSCEIQSMQSVFSRKPVFPLDGVLFYHNEVTYEPGPTPLIGWLKPYMLPEWFPGLTIHPEFLSDMPVEYTNYLDEIRQQEQKNISLSKGSLPSTVI